MQIREIDADITEPVDMATVKSYCRIDADYTSDDTDLLVSITSARQRLEAYLNIGLVKRNIELQWDGKCVEMPLSPTGELVSVKDGDTILTADQYSINSFQAKSIQINNTSDSNFSYFYSETGSVEVWESSTSVHKVYKCIYSTGYEVLPSGLKMALLAEIDYLFKQRGMPDNSVISDAAMLLSHGWSRNLVL